MAVERLQLKAVARNDARLLNRIFRRNGNLVFRLGQEELSLAFLHFHQGYIPEFVVDIMVGKMTFRVSLDQLFFTNPAGVFPEEDISRLPREIRAAVLEVFLEELLDGLDRLTGSSSTISGIDFQPPREPPDGGVFFHLTRPRDNRTLSGHLSMDRPAMEWLAGLLESLPPGPGWSLGHLPVSARFEIGDSRLSLQDLKNLERLDIILLEEYLPAGGGEIRVRFSPDLCLSAVLEKNRVTIGKIMEESMPAEDTGKKSAQQADINKKVAASLDALEIRVVFELGEKRISLAELKHLQPGHTFELETDPEKPVSIAANGKVLGRGELVQIDGRIGVRVLDFFGEADDRNA